MFKNVFLTARWALLGLCLVFTGSHAAPVLQVNANGILTGATGVVVSGELYDVTFVDGSCSDLFGGCNALGDFMFPSYGAARSASLALLDQVFVDVPAVGNFDTSPSLTRGCSDSGICYAFTPYGFISTSAVLVHYAKNIDGTAIYDGFGFVPYSLVPADTSTLSSTTWAVWAPHVTAVPEPTTTATLAVGLAMIWSRRKYAAL